MLYVYDTAGEGTTDNDCQTSYLEVTDATGTWRPVELSGFDPPNAGTTTATFRGELNTANGKYYLVIMNSLGLWCFAYYHDPSPDAATAFGYANNDWPLVGTSQYIIGVPTCAPPSPAPSPPPPSPSPPPPSPSPPPSPPPRGTLQVRNIASEIPGHAGMNCDPFDRVATYPEGINAPTVPLLFVYDQDGGAADNDCQTLFLADPDGTGAFYPRRDARVAGPQQWRHLDQDGRPGARRQPLPLRHERRGTVVLGLLPHPVARPRDRLWLRRRHAPP